MTWASVSVAWYDGATRIVELTSQTAVWYRAGKPPVTIRWVLIRDPESTFDPQVLLCTDPAADPTRILEWFVLRWQLEVTFQEAHHPDPLPIAAVVPALAVIKTTGDLLVCSRDDWCHRIDEDGGCQDARDGALAAESRTEVTYRSDRRCRVDAGQWLAPYSGMIVTVPGDLDIDHMVPLANAHRIGRVLWLTARCCRLPGICPAEWAGSGVYASD